MRSDRQPLALRPSIQALLAENGLHVTEVRRLARGWQARTSEGPIVTILRTGKIYMPGVDEEVASKFIQEFWTEIMKVRRLQWLSKQRLSKRQ
jgi:hypothetical protein